MKKPAETSYNWLNFTAEVDRINLIVCA